MKWVIKSEDIINFVTEFNLKMDYGPKLCKCYVYKGYGPLVNGAIVSVETLVDKGYELYNPKNQ